MKNVQKIKLKTHFILLQLKKIVQFIHIFAKTKYMGGLKIIGQKLKRKEPDRLNKKLSFIIQKLIAF